MKNLLVVLLVVFLPPGLLGCGGGQVKKGSSATASIRQEPSAPAGMDQKGWSVKNRRGTFVFTDAIGAVRGGYLSSAGLAALNNKVSIEKFGDTYFSRLNSYKSDFSKYGRSRPPTLIKVTSDVSGNLILEPLTMEEQNKLPGDYKQYAINQIFFDGQIGDFLARPKDKLIIIPNEAVKVKAFNKIWECKYIGNGLGEISVDATGFTYGTGVTCQ